MKYRIASVMTVLCLGMTSVLSGCEKTPEDVLVTQKGKDNIAEYASTEDDGTSIRERIKAPEHYQNTVTSDDKLLKIATDADVEVPDLTSVDTITVGAVEMDQTMMDKITEVLFGDSPIYNWNTYEPLCKADRQLELDQLKQAKAEGNLYPRGFKEGSLGNPYDIDADIAELEESVANMEETPIKEAVTPQFGLHYIVKGEDGEEDEEWTDTDSFSGIVETDHGVYDYQLYNTREDAISTGIEVCRQEEPEIGLKATTREKDQEVAAEKENKEEMEELAGLSYEDAAAQAETLVEQLEKAIGISGLELNDYNYQLYFSKEASVDEDRESWAKVDMEEETPYKVGYCFHFARVINGMPITYETFGGGGFEEDINAETVTVTWDYEECDVIITKDGLEFLQLKNPYEIGEKRNESVALLDFDTIVKNYEDMMLISNADLGEDGEERTYHIDRIKLGYSRIYDPKADSETGVLVPVWDFFGTFEDQIKGEEGTDVEDTLFHSMMTINAIDGTIINRELGY